MQPLPDPRFQTDYTADFRGRRFYEPGPDGRVTITLPAYAYERYCEPGYQPVRPNKGSKLRVNDYALQPELQYGGPNWFPHVHTPFLTRN